jgi:hypothetical protein
MQPDLHERARWIVGRSVVEGVTPDEERWLQSHLSQCDECARYAELSARAVDALGEFAFDVDSAAALRVRETVRARAGQMGASPAGWLQAWAMPLALALTALGSAAVWRVAGLLAARWGVPAEIWHAAFVTCWVVPSAVVDGLLLVRGRIDGSSNEGGM